MNSIGKYSTLNLAKNLSKMGWAQWLLGAVSFLLMSYLLISVWSKFSPQYFEPGFLVEFRSFATIETAIAFHEGDNPFAVDYPRGRSNLYSVTWPLLIKELAEVSDKLSPEGFREVAFLTNSLILAACLVCISAICLRHKLGISLTSAIVILILFANLIRFGLGEWPHAAGLNLSCVGLALSVNSEKSFLKICCASILIALAASFKIYFVLCAAPLIVSSVFYMLKSYRNTSRLVFLTLSLLFVIVIIGKMFPTYFAHVIGVHSLFVSYTQPLFSEVRVIYQLCFWYYIALLICLHNVVEKNYSLVEIMQFSSALCMVLYVTFSMGTHSGNAISYTVHIVTPLLVFLLLLVKGSSERSLAGVIILLMVFFSWSFENSRWFGVLEQKDVLENQETIGNVRSALASIGHHKVYVTPALSFLVPDSSIELVDTGNREFISEWTLRKYEFDEHWLYRYLGWSALDLREHSYSGLQSKADYVICTSRCPKKDQSYEFVEKLGNLKLAHPQDTEVHLYKNTQRGLAKIIQ